MGSGIGSIETSLKRLFSGAREEIAITAYAISNSADPIFEWIEAALMRGVLVKLIYNKQTGKKNALARLKLLAKDYRHFHVYDFADKKTYDLHAKAVVADRQTAIVGSSNLSVSAMLGNHELAVLIEGLPASNVARVIDRLLKSDYATRLTS